MFKTVVKDISQDLPLLGEPGSEVSYFIPDTINVSEVTRLSDDINKPWLKATIKEIKNIINNQTLLVQDPEKGEPITSFVGVYKAKIQSGGILYKLKFRIVVQGYLQNKELFGDTWSPTASKRNLKYFLADAYPSDAVTR